MLPDQPYFSKCPNCAASIDVTALEPYVKIGCPECRQPVRVRLQFDHYVITREIGAGGMSRVFEAEDINLKRPVALKILNRTYSRDAARMQQFQHEALITARVTHANVIKLYSAGFDQGHFFIAMELVNGGSLESRIKKEGSVPEKAALTIGRQVADGLRAAFRVGLLHRDVKPANILFTEQGVAKVVDFGLALFAGRKDESGEIWATPYYVSPEKVIENHEDFRSDLFSLGATLYHAMTGQLPHKADTNSIEALRLIKCRRVALEESGQSFAPRTIHVVDKLLAFKPEERPASYDEAVDELRLAEGLTEHTIVPMSTRRKVLFGAVAMLVLAFGVGWLLQSWTAAPAENNTSSETIEGRTLIGTARTVKAGETTIGDRYEAARDLMLKRDFQPAFDQFKGVIDDGAVQPTLNRARFNAALCALGLKDKDKALGLIKDAQADAAKAPRDTCAALYTKLTAHLAANAGLDLKLTQLTYEASTEEVLGYLVHGMAQWYLGDGAQAKLCLEKFQSSRMPDLKLEWIEQKYRPFVRPYLDDAALLTQVASLDRVGLNKLRDQMQTDGAARDAVNTRLKKLDADERQLRRQTQTADIKAMMEQRRSELEQLKEISSLLPTLVRGYDHRPAVDMLASLNFESPEVKAAIETKRYLHAGMVEFMQLLQKDVMRKPWQGKLQRRSGAPMEGRVTALSTHDLTLQPLGLSSGGLSIPLDQIAPDSLGTIALDFAKLVSDTPERFHREELIAVFARLADLKEMESALVNPLMDESREFRDRWLRVLQTAP